MTYNYTELVQLWSVQQESGLYESYTGPLVDECYFYSICLPHGAVKFVVYFSFYIDLYVDFPS